MAIRRRYTWYLCPSFKFKFDRSNWWKEKKGKPYVTPSSALYELARRHPLVRETWLRNYAANNCNRSALVVRYPNIRERLTVKIGEASAAMKQLPSSLQWTCLLGLNSWPRLTYTDRRNWESCAGKLKGLDFRKDFEKSRSIRVDAYQVIFNNRRRALVDGTMTFTEGSSIVKADLVTNPPTAEEWEAAIAESAVQAHRHGLVLLAVVPDLAAEELTSVLSASYRQHSGMFPPPKPPQRARWQDWLPLISTFEDAQTTHSHSTAKSQDFARYRRAVDGIRFL